MKRYTDKAFHADASDLNHEGYQAGCRHFNGGDYRRAISSFEEAVSYWPKDAQAWMALGNCYDELKNPADAERCFREALKHCSEKNLYGIRYNLGNSLLDQNKYEAAIQLYEQIPKESALYELARKNMLIARSAKPGKESET